MVPSPTTSTADFALARTILNWDRENGYSTAFAGKRALLRMCRNADCIFWLGLDDWQLAEVGIRSYARAALLDFIIKKRGFPAPCTSDRCGMNILLLTTVDAIILIVAFGAYLNVI